MIEVQLISFFESEFHLFHFRKRSPQIAICALETLVIEGSVSESNFKWRIIVGDFKAEIQDVTSCYFVSLTIY